MGERLSTQDFVKFLVEKHGIGKETAEAFIKEFFLLIENALEKEKSVKVKGFGTFKLIEVESRESINVNTGERFEIQGHTKISFSPDSAIRDLINKPFSHFETVVLNDNVAFEDEEANLVEEPVEDQSISLESDKDVTEENPVEDDVNKYIEEKKPIPEINEIVVDNNSSNMANKEKTEPKSDVVVMKKKSATPYIITIVILAIALGLALLWNYPAFRNLFNAGETNNPPVEISITDPDDNLVVSDSIDSSENNVDTIEQTGSNIIQTSPAPIIPDSTSYIIVGVKTSHTLKEGETLVQVALKYYGSKSLWPYLVMFNRHIIKNPDVVPVGTKLEVPEIQKK